MAEAVITGIGLVTPLGCRPDEVVDRILRKESAVREAPFQPPLACPSIAEVIDFDAAGYFPDNKTLRLMNRDAQMAVVAARLAMQDAGVTPGALYFAEDIALYGATGLSGMSADEVMRLVRDTAGPDGSLDLERFGRVGLKRLRPVLSFKILANMPICFVSIFENLRGPNAVYGPWEGQGAQAVAAGIRSVCSGEVPCAVVGACDVKTHALSFVTLGQIGALDSWARCGLGTVPGEGAAFLVLEEHQRAIRRGARIYARVREPAMRSVAADSALVDALAETLRGLPVIGSPLVVAAGDGDVAISEAEQTALLRAGLHGKDAVYPKAHLGNLFAASAAVQVAIGAVLAWRGCRVQGSGFRVQGSRESRPARPETPAPGRGILNPEPLTLTPEPSPVPPPAQVLVNCFGYGTEQAAFLLEAA